MTWTESCARGIASALQSDPDRNTPDDLPEEL